MHVLCLDFINSQWYQTHRPFKELLTNKAWITEFCRRWNLPVWDPETEDPHALFALRDFLFDAAVSFCKDRMLHQHQLDTLNDQLRKAVFYEQVEQPDGNGCQLRICAQRKGMDIVADRVLRSFAELITLYPAKQLKICANEECDWIFYDDSRNHTRKWCDNTCAASQRKNAQP